MNLRRTGILLAAALAFPATLTAQQPTLEGIPGTPPKVLSLPASVRAMALGGAYMMNAGHADALFYHPALLTGASGFGLEIQRWSERASASAASAAVGWLGGGVGIGLQTLQTSLPGFHVPEGQAILLSGGALPMSERVATVGYARRLFGVQLGVAGKLVEERLGAASSTTVLMDVGAARSLGPITLGLTVQDLGNDAFQMDGGFGPARVVLGAGSYGRPVGPLDVGFTAALSHGRDDFRVGGGLEFGYWPVNGRTFVARVGLQTTPEGDEGVNPFTFGLAFWGDDLVLEWAYQGLGDLGGNTHRFGVRWR